MSEPAKSLWVVMGNDYPCGVFNSEERALRWIEQVRSADRTRKQREGLTGPGVYYRTYPFTLNAGEA